MRSLATEASRAAGSPARTRAGHHLGQLIVILSLLAACSTQRLTEGEVPDIQVTLQPLSVTVPVGQTRSFTLTMNPAGAGAPTWASSNPAVASISNSGVVTGNAVGSTRISASVAGVSAEGDVTVTAAPPAPVATVAVSPTAAGVQVGGTTQLVATTRDASGNVLTGRTITWGSSNPSVASVSNAGLVTGAAVGQATISATSEGQSGNSVVTVSAAPPPPPTVTGLELSPSSATLTAGGTQQFGANERLSNGGTRIASGVSWSATGGTVTSSGLYTAGGSAGTYRVIAVGQTGHADTAAITINVPPPPPPPTVTALVLSPASATLATAATQQFTATEMLSSGSSRTATGVTWTATGGTVSASGLYTAGSTAGTSYRVIARGTSGHADTANITINAPPPPPPPPTVTALVLSPSSASLLTAAIQQFTATEQLSNGTSRAASGVTWSATGGTVTSGGLYTAGAAAGSYRVIATGTTGHADTSSITITIPPVGSCSAPNLLSHGFDNQSFSPLSGTEGAYITADATARGGYSVRKDWTGGSHDGSTIWANFASTRTVYARWRFKYDTRFDTDGIFKMIRFHAPNLGTMNGTLLIQWGRFVWAWDTFSSGVYHNVGAEITPASLAGGWHWYEIMNDISVDGSPRVRMWIDGQLKMDATLSSTAATNGLSFGTIQWTGTYNSPAATATSWLDDVAVSTSCIGIPSP